MSDQPGNTYPNQPQPPRYTEQNQQGAYANYTQMYGQQLPAHMEKPQVPQALKTAALLMYCIAGLAIISDALEIFFYDEIQAKANDALATLMGSPDFTSSLGPAADLEGGSQVFSLVFGMIFSLIWNGLAVVSTIFMVKGHNWGRIVSTIYASLVALGILGALLWLLVFHWSMVIGVVGSLLAIATLVFLWRQPVSEYMTQSTIYRQWVQHQAYMVPRS